MELSKDELIEYKNILIQALSGGINTNETKSNNETSDETIIRLKTKCIDLDKLKNRKDELKSRLSENNKECLRKDEDMIIFYKYIKSLNIF